MTSHDQFKGTSKN